MQKKNLTESIKNISYIKNQFQICQRRLVELAHICDSKSCICQQQQSFTNSFMLNIRFDALNVKQIPYRILSRSNVNPSKTFLPSSRIDVTMAPREYIPTLSSFLSNGNILVVVIFWLIFATGCKRTQGSQDHRAFLRWLRK